MMKPINSDKHSLRQLCRRGTTTLYCTDCGRRAFTGDARQLDKHPCTHDDE